MPIMFYAFFIIGRTWKENTRKKEGKSRLSFSKFAQNTRTWRQNEVFLFLSLSYTLSLSYQRNRISMSTIRQEWRRSSILVARYEITTCSRWQLARTIPPVLRYQIIIMFAFSSRAPLHHRPPRRVFIIGKLITRNKSERHAEGNRSERVRRVSNYAMLWAKRLPIMFYASFIHGVPKKRKRRISRD